MIGNSFRVTIPAKEGFVDRVCSSIKCQKEFAIAVVNLKSRLYCPYCGELQDITSQFTKEQKEYALKVASEEIMEDLSKELSSVFRNAFGNNRAIQFKESLRYTKNKVKEPTKITIDSQIECSVCNGKYQVRGIFGYCPLCRYENIKIYDANLDIIELEIKTSGCTQRSLRHAYQDLVSTFEGFCKKKYPEATNINFQNLRNAKSYIKKNYGIYIFRNITENEKTCIRRIFEKRHVYNHPVGDEGIVSAKYVKEVPQDKMMLGEKANLSVEEFNEGAKILRKIVSNIAIA